MMLVSTGWALKGPDRLCACSLHIKQLAIVKSISLQRCTSKLVHGYGWNHLSKRWRSDGVINIFMWTKCRIFSSLFVQQGRTQLKPTGSTLRRQSQQFQKYSTTPHQSHSCHFHLGIQRQSQFFVYSVFSYVSHWKNYLLWRTGFKCTKAADGWF